MTFTSCYFSQLSKVRENGFQALKKNLEYLGSDDDLDHCSHLYSNDQLYVHTSCRMKCTNSVKSQQNAEGLLQNLKYTIVVVAVT